MKTVADYGRVFTDVIAGTARSKYRRRSLDTREVVMRCNSKAILTVTRSVLRQFVVVSQHHASAQALLGHAATTRIACANGSVTVKFSALSGRACD